MRCYWFEIFECARKIALTCIPQMMPPGSIDQAVLGLLISFITFAMYTSFGPFDDDGNDRLSSVAQLIVFMSLVFALVNIAGDVTTFVGVLIPLCILLPMSYVLLQKSGIKGLLGKTCTRAGKATDSAGLSKQMTRKVDSFLGTKMVFRRGSVAVQDGKKPDDPSPPTQLFSDEGKPAPPDTSAPSATSDAYNTFRENAPAPEIAPAPETAPAPEDVSAIADAPSAAAPGPAPAAEAKLDVAV